MKHIILIILFTLGVWAENSIFLKRISVPNQLIASNNLLAIETVDSVHVAVYQNKDDSLSIVDFLNKKEISKIEQPFINKSIEHIHDVNDTKEKTFEMTNYANINWYIALLDPKSKMLFLYASRYGVNSQKWSTVKAFDVVSGKEIWAVNADAPIAKMAVYKDILVLGDTTGKVHLWSIDTPRQIRTLDFFHSMPDVRTLIVFEKDDLLAVHNNTGELGRIYNLKTDSEIQTFNFKPKTTDEPIALNDFAYHNKILYSTGPTGEVYAVNTNEKNTSIQIGSFDKTVLKVDTTSSGSYIVARSAWSIKVWEGKTYHEVYKYNEKHPHQKDDPQIEYQILNDNEILIGSCKEGLLFKYNLTTKVTEPFIISHKRCIQMFTLDPKGQYVFAINEDGSITTWDLATKQEIAHYEHKQQ